MKRHQFRSEDEYRKYQLRITRRKFKNGKKPQCYTVPAVAHCINEVLQQEDSPCTTGLAHGVRTGRELDYLRRHCSGLWIGTEITPELCDNDNIFEHDFRKPRKGWEKSFDVVYTNSLDHSDDPLRTLGVWREQVSIGGWLVVEWSIWSETFRTNNKADAFAASLHEYCELMDTGLQLKHIRRIPKREADNTFDRYILFSQ